MSNSSSRETREERWMPEDMMPRPRGVRLGLTRSCVVLCGVIVVGTGTASCHSSITPPRNDAAIALGSAAIGPGGGYLQSTDGRVNLRIPVGALTEALIFTITAASAPPQGAIGNAYALAPDGFSFAIPATITMAYDPGLLGSAAPDAVTLSTAVNRTWVAEPGSFIDPSAHVVAALVFRLSQWAITPAPDSASCGCNRNVASISAAVRCAKYDGTFDASGSGCACCAALEGGDIAHFAVSPRCSPS